MPMLYYFKVAKNTGDENANNTNRPKARQNITVTASESYAHNFHERIPKSQVTHEVNHVERNP